MCLLVVVKGTEVNAVDDNGDTSLHTALQKGNVRPAEVLLVNGADCKVLNECGETVLHFLCKGGVDRHQLCEDLISHGVNPHLADRKGNLPLHIALKKKLPNTSWLLFKQWGGSTLDDLNIQNTDISYLLCFAVSSHDAEVCQKLLDLGANPNTPNSVDELPDVGLPAASSVHPLHIAVANNSSKLCSLLLDHGATVNVPMEVHRNKATLHLAQPLHLAVQLGFIDVCRLLIERGALINGEMKEGKTPLHLAIVANKDDIARHLLSNGAILDKVKIGGVSALRRSAKLGTRSLASLLRNSSE